VVIGAARRGTQPVHEYLRGCPRDLRVEVRERVDKRWY
jgi:hypothetical protein